MLHETAGGLRPPAPPTRFSALWLGCAAAALIAAALPAPARAEAASARPIAAEIRSEVDGQLKDFYRDRGYRPLWIRDGTLGPEADRLVELVASADLDGLDPTDYDPGKLRRTIDEARGGSAEDLAEAEIRLSRTFADYVRDVRRPSSVKIVYLDEELEPDRPQRADVLRAAAVAPSLAGYLDEAGWTNPFYARLREALAEHRTHWAALPRLDIPAGPALRAGSTGGRVRMLRQRLGLPDGALFDGAVEDEVAAFQAAHGLPVDGIVGAATIAALNRGPAHHERKIRLNMERARALPPLANGRHIVVDAAIQRLWLYEDGEAVDSMKVIVGKPSQPTPMLAGVMRYAVVNPYWNVPPDLVRTSILPKLEASGGTLQDMGYEALSGWTRDARVLEPHEIDWGSVAAGAEQLRVRQLPGRGNAMGKVKFMFPNDLGIYLHDTPDKALFDEEERRFSSGCVRVEDAARLAEWLFGAPIETESDAPEQEVYLKRPVPVYITYLTAAPTEEGIAFREDAYGRDDLRQERYASR